MGTFKKYKLSTKSWNGENSHCKLGPGCKLTSHRPKWSSTVSGSQTPQSLHSIIYRTDLFSKNGIIATYFLYVPLASFMSTQWFSIFKNGLETMLESYFASQSEIIHHYCELNSKTVLNISNWSLYKVRQPVCCLTLYTIKLIHWKYYIPSIALICPNFRIYLIWVYLFL